MSGNVWISLDGKIKKVILKAGHDGLKPSENAECHIKTSDPSFQKTIVRVGDNDGEYGRLLDITLQTMNVHELARVKFATPIPSEFTIELQKLVPCGLIYEWTSLYKYNLATEHKEKGVVLFKAQHNVDASYRFSKALKILHSVPSDATKPPPVVAEVSAYDMSQLKATLCNNLASCYLKIKDYDRVVELCELTLKNDADNVKAMYKIATSAYELHDYEKAMDCYKKVLAAEPDNKAAQQGILKTGLKLKEQDQAYKDIVKKMF